MSNVTQLWDACAQSIRDQVSDGVWQSTFKEARPQSITENELILTVPNQWVKAQVEGKYNPLVLEALEEALQGSRDVIAHHGLLGVVQHMHCALWFHTV